MIYLQHFSSDDADVIKTHQYPDMPIDEIPRTISEWNSRSFQGRYFEMFAVLNDETIIGSISLFQRSRSVASVSVGIFEPYRRSGLASEAMLLIMEHAKKLGYNIIQDQVRTDNAASIRLHEKLSFESDHYVYRNEKGNPVYLFLKAL